MSESNTKRLSIALISLTAGLVGWFVVDSDRQDATASNGPRDQPAPSSIVTDHETAAAILSSTHLVGGAPNFIATDYTTFAHFQFFAWDPDAGTVTVFEAEMTDMTNYTLEKVHFVYSVAYDLVGVASYHRDRFWVVGRAPNGDTIVEKWVKSKSLGVTLPSLPGYGPAQPTVQRTELYRGSAIGPVTQFDVDPDKDFLLFAHDEPRRLSVMPLPTIVPYTTLYDELTIPELADIGSFTCIDLYGLGRVWMTTPTGTTDRLFFIDSDSDGAIDDYDLLSWEEYDANYNELDLDGIVYFHD